MSKAKEVVTDKDMKVFNLHGAVLHRRMELVKELIKRGADVDARNAEGETPLLMAAYYNEVAMAKVLLDAGANVCAQDNMGRLAEEWAGAYDEEGEPMLKLLKKYREVINEF